MELQTAQLNEVTGQISSLNAKIQEVFEKINEFRDAQSGNSSETDTEIDIEIDTEIETEIDSSETENLWNRIEWNSAFLLSECPKVSVLEIFYKVFYVFQFFICLKVQ